MKEKPYATTPKANKSTKPKLPFIVYLDEEPYHTSAYNHQGAISNAAYRYAEENDETVALIMWKIKNNQIDCFVEDREEEI
jgi:hypothetical protein